MTQERANATRTKARKRALDILYESELRDRPVAETLADRVGGLQESPVRPFTIELVTAWGEHADAVDATLAASLTGGWTLERMARVDRNLARLAVVEVVHGDTPAPVAIAEAVRLAAEFSTPESPAFLNGLLTAALARATAEPSNIPDPDNLPEDATTE